MLCRYRSSPRARSCGRSRNRLARQEHHVDRRAIGHVVFPRRNSDDARTATGCAATRSLRHLRRAASTACPTGAITGTASAGCAPLHFVSDDRTERLDSAGISAVDRRPDFWLRRLPGRMPVESVCASFDAKSLSPRDQPSHRCRYEIFWNLMTLSFAALFRDSPIKRIKRRGFLRNVCVALGNVGTLDDLPALERAMTDSEPLIAEHAAWAIDADPCSPAAM